jgi:hypothetical protein
MKITRVFKGSSVRSIRHTLVGGLALMAALAGATGCSTTVSTSSSACSTDSSVVCAVGDGWSCDGDSQPEDANPSLICNTDGQGDFCCVASSCGYDSSVSCSGSAVGYSCASGDAPPDQTDSTLVCSEPTVVGGTDEYCCYTNTIVVSSSSTCQEDGTVSCQGDSYGFSCTGPDTPDQDYSNLNCSSPTSGPDASGNPASLFCCAYQ